jgi:hypothetical protein
MALAWAPFASAQQQSGGGGKQKVDRQDARALRNLARADLAEVQAGKLATQKASRDESRW